MPIARPERSKYTGLKEEGDYGEYQIERNKENAACAPYPLPSIQREIEKRKRKQKRDGERDAFP